MSASRPALPAQYRQPCGSGPRSGSGRSRRVAGHGRLRNPTSLSSLSGAWERAHSLVLTLQIAGPGCRAPNWPGRSRHGEVCMMGRSVGNWRLVGLQPLARHRSQPGEPSDAAPAADRPPLVSSAPCPAPPRPPAAGCCLLCIGSLITAPYQTPAATDQQLATSAGRSYGCRRRASAVQ